MQFAEFQSLVNQRWGRLVAFVTSRPVTCCLIMTAAVSVFFILFPGVDIAVSRLFFVEGEGFPASRSPFMQDLRALGFSSFRWVLAAAILSLMFYAFSDFRRFLLPARGSLLIVFSALIGPGIVINLILKDFWGRARPINITDFGGDKLFSPAWEIAGQCDSNCSFVSGEASTAILMIILALICPIAWRAAVLAGTLVFAAAISGARLAFGGHFLSDIVISWGITLTILFLLRSIIYDTKVFYDEYAAKDWLADKGNAFKKFVRLKLSRIRPD